MLHASAACQQGPTMRIEKIYRYPVKGLAPEALDETPLHTGLCIQHDRRFALAQGDAPFDPARPEFLPKQNFACMMAHPRVVLIRSVFDPHDNRLAMSAPGMPALSANPTTPEGRAAIGAWMTRFLGDEARGQPVFHDVAGHNFTDQVKKGVSLFNLNSLSEFETRIGRKLHPLRFRANFYFNGLAPWEEFNWIGKEILLGSARLRVFKVTVRCPATMVDLDTGERDCNTPALLFEQYGHRDLGVHAEVIEDGRAAIGDAVEPL
jgi:uncharacterized protein YcbX